MRAYVHACVKVFEFLCLYKGLINHVFVINTNKINSTTGAVPVKTNLLATSIVTAQFLLQMQNKKMFDLENESESDEGKHLQLRNSKATVKIYERYIYQILALHIFVS